MRIIVYDCLESTNTTAKEMALSGAEHGTVIIANRQKAGRGRYGRKFFSPAKHGLYMSVILYSDRMPEVVPTMITAFAAVSVCEVIESVLNKDVQIKWVNDIFIDGRKVCGILTEAVTAPGTPCPRRFIVGIGINVSTPDEEFPEELKHIAGSLFGSENPPINTTQLAADICKRIAFPKEPINEAEILTRYKQRMFLFGKPVIVTVKGDTFEAFAEDIDNTGRLVVRKPDGELYFLIEGDVKVTGFDRGR